MLHQVGIEILITNLIGIDLNLPEGYQFMERILHTHNKLLFWRIKYFTLIPQHYYKIFFLST